jgi:hypothetical protein
MASISASDGALADFHIGFLYSVFERSGYRFA